MNAPRASSLAGVEIDRRRFVLLPDRQVAYLVVSKVACTSIKTALGRAYGIRPEVPHAIHGREHFRYCRGELPAASRHYFTFAFVRDPFDRLLSCYRDKVLYREGHPLYPEPYFRHYPYPITPNMPFRDFVRVIAEIPDRHADRHFKSQYAVLHRQGVLLPDFVGRFETLARDWRVVAERCGFERVLDHLHPSAATTPAVCDLESYFSDPELVGIVSRRYRRDLEAFGYESAYPACLLEASASNV